MTELIKISENSTTPLTQTSSFNTSRMRVLTAEPINQILQKRLEKAGYQVDYKPDTSAGELLKMVNNYDGLVVRSRFRFDSDFFSNIKNLKFIARAGSGIENINAKAAREAGVEIINSPEGNANSVAEHALGLLLALMHKISSSADEVKNGVWNRKSNAGDELSSKTAGIIGYGNTGSRFAQLLSGFGIKVLVYDKYKSGFSSGNIQESKPAEIFEKADILSFHLPLTTETEYLCNINYLKNFQKPIYLINTSRGKIVDTEAVYKSLKNNQIIAAGLDVLEYEKHNFDTLLHNSPPEILKKLTNLPNVIITPHVAGSSKQSVVKIASVLADKIIAKYGSF